MTSRPPLEDFDATRSDAHASANDSSVSSDPAVPSSALIIHPMSLYSNTSSPIYSHEWFLSAYNLQKQEALALYDHQQQQLQQQQQQQQYVITEKPRLCLLDFTCDENIEKIFGFLDGVSLCRVQRVNRSFHRLGGNDLYWYNLCKAEWAISPDQLKARPESYQDLYKYTCKSLKLLIRDFFEEQCLTSMQHSFRIPRDTAMMITRGTVPY